MRLLTALIALLALPVSAEARHPPAHIHSQFFGTGPAKCNWHDLERQAPDLPMREGVSIRFLGNIPARHYEYFIYHYEFNNPENSHGHQRILVMGRGCKYAGQYYVIARPIRVRGNDIIFDAPKAYGNIIHFPNRMPPAQAWIDGEVHNFTR